MESKTVFDSAATRMIVVVFSSAALSLLCPCAASAQLKHETALPDTFKRPAESKSEEASAVPATAATPSTFALPTTADASAAQPAPIQGGVSRFAVGAGVTKGGDAPGLEGEHPISDEMVQKYVMPLVWVKIPKAFAGIWETRTETVLGGLSAFRVSVAENGKISQGPTQVGESASSFSAINKYRFVRGVQIDEHGEIWDCPSLNNFQQRQLGMGTIVVTKTWAISERKIFSITDNEMVEELTRSSMAVTNPAFSISSVRMHIDRRLISPSEVDARWSFSFGKFGNEAVGETLLIPEYKIAEFQPVDHWHGIDLKASLKDFLKEQAR